MQPSQSATKILGKAHKKGEIVLLDPQSSAVDECGNRMLKVKDGGWICVEDSDGHNLIPLV